MWWFISPPNLKSPVPTIHYLLQWNRTTKQIFAHLPPYIIWYSTTSPNNKFIHIQDVLQYINQPQSYQRLCGSSLLSLRAGHFIISCKVKCSRYRPGVTQRVSRVIALLFHDRGTRIGVSGQQHAPAALYPLERPGTHFTGDRMGPRAGLDGRKISIPDRPARSQSLYRLSYPAHYYFM
jgi:hypothetical protein